MEKIYNKIKELISLQEERELSLLNEFRKNPNEFFKKGDFFRYFVVEYNTTSSTIKTLESLIANEKYESMVEIKPTPTPLKEIFSKNKDKKESKGEWKNIKEMAAAISSHAVWNILKGGKVEHSIYWKDGSYNTLLKARPDRFTDDLIVDIKTTESIKAFPRVLYSYGYHRQAAMQMDALFKTDNKKRYFAFFVVEKKPPYLTACYTLDNKSIDLGREEYIYGAELYSQCLSENSWPGYDEQFKLIKLPNYLKTNEEIYND